MSKEANQLSDEFKKEVKDSGSKKNILGTLTALIAIALVFGTIGVAGYELIFKPEKIMQKTADEKIESRPETKTVEVKTEEVAVTPAPATTAPTSTEYIVASGDSYSSIANANGLSSTELMQYNGVTAEDLQIGQTIKIPKK